MDPNFCFSLKEAGEEQSNRLSFTVQLMPETDTLRTECQEERRLCPPKICPVTQWDAQNLKTILVFVSSKSIC